ncbi:THO complex subunit 3, partial [Nowakowskiella sp. JEL0078]
MASSERAKDYSRLFSKATARELRGHKGKVQSVGWNCDGRRIASGSGDQTARVWSLSQTSSSLTANRDSTELRGHQGEVVVLCWDPLNTDRLATASVDKTVRLWDVRIPKCTNVINTPGENINLVWAHDGNCIAVGDKKDLISFIDPKMLGTNSTLITDGTKTTEQSTAICGEIKNEVEVNEIGWNNSLDLFFMSTGEGTIKILEYPSFKHIHTVYAHTANCCCLEFDPRGRYFATGSADAIVSLWDVEDFVCVRTFGGLDWPVRSISFSFDGELIASGSEDNWIEIVIVKSHVESGETVHKIKCKAATNTVAWHPNRFLLAYAGDETEKRMGRSDAEGNLRIFGFT